MAAFIQLAAVSKHFLIDPSDCMVYDLHIRKKNL